VLPAGGLISAAEDAAVRALQVVDPVLKVRLVAAASAGSVLGRHSAWSKCGL
jgi:alkyl hydroperoxide reductase subunit AhpC